MQGWKLAQASVNPVGRVEIQDFLVYLLGYSPNGEYYQNYR